MPINPPTINNPIAGAGDRLSASKLTGIPGEGGANQETKDLNLIRAQSLDPALFSAYTDAFFNYYEVDGADYNQIYGYQLAITESGKVLKYISFPINPTNIQMSTPVASTVTVTLRGVNEDHGGAPLRNIRISGTSGVFHGSSSSVGYGRQDGSSSIDYLFRNTIQAVSRVRDQAQRLTQTITGGVTAQSGPLNYDLTNDVTLQRKTGYYWFHQLMRFLDYYVAKKKTRAGKDLRLTLCMNKDRMYYDVILRGYSWAKQPGTIEYNYQLDLEAYRRRPTSPLGEASAKAKRPSQVTSVSTLASVIGGIREGRKLLAQSADVLRGIRADAEESFFTPLREVILAAGQVAGIVSTIADFPQSIVNSAKAAIESALKDVGAITQEKRDSVSSTLKSFNLRSDDTRAQGTPLDDKLVQQSQDGLSETAPRTESANPVEKAFQDPTKFVAVFEEFSPDDLNLPEATLDAIASERERVSLLDIPDYRARRERLRSFAASVSAALGGRSEGYEAIYGRQGVDPTFRVLSVDDMMLLSQINDVLMGVDQLIAAIQDASPSPDDDYFLFYRDQAQASGLQFQDAASKFFVPFPVGASLQQLALQYLNDSNRWQEIAAINGLKEPYIDEEGFTVPLIANSTPGSVQVATDDGLYVGQVVDVQSDSAPTVTRKIRSVEKIQTNQYLVTLEGGNTAGYTTAANARLKAFRPDTVNSRRLIAIPSPEAVTVPGQIRLTPGREDLNNIGQVAKVDFLVDSSGQMVLNGNGDVVLAYGIQNLTQAALMRVLTPAGSLLQDPTYGNPIRPGTSIATVSAPNVVAALQSQFQDDPRFSGLLAARVKVEGRAAFVDLLLGISGTDVNLPVRTQLPL